MHFLGLAGMPRRIPDYPAAYLPLNEIATLGSYISIISLVVFFFTVFELFTLGYDKLKIKKALNCLHIINAAILHESRNRSLFNSLNRVAPLHVKTAFDSNANLINQFFEHYFTVESRLFFLRATDIEFAFG